MTDELFDKYRQIRQQEEELQSQRRQLESQLQEIALEQQATGRFYEYSDGFSLEIKYRRTKPKSSNFPEGSKARQNLETLEEWVEIEREKAEAANRERIQEVEQQIKDLQAELDELRNTSAGREYQREIDGYAELVPQISLKKPKKRD